MDFLFHCRIAALASVARTRTAAELLIPYALLNGEVVHVDDVPTGIRCGAECPVCKERLIAKNALESREVTRKRGRKSRQHYFSHAADSTSTGCGEGWLHIMAKRFLAERIERGVGVFQAFWQIMVSSPCELPSFFRCVNGDEPNHTRNLIEGVDSIEVEREVTGAEIRPDIFLRGKQPKLVEIVVTQYPKAPVFDYARSKGIPLVVIPVRSGEDLEAIRSGEVIPADVFDYSPSGCRERINPSAFSPLPDWRQMAVRAPRRSLGAKRRQTAVRKALCGCGELVTVYPDAWMHRCKARSST